MPKGLREEEKMVKTPKLRINQHGYIERVESPDASYSPPMTIEEKKAIVRAVNAHDGLLESMKKVLFESDISGMVDTDSLFEQLQVIKDIAKAAIARASQ